MTEEHFDTFRKSFDRLCSTFRLKLKPIEANELCRSYFQLLEQFPLDDVLQAGKACLAKSKSFPKPAQWLAELTVQSGAMVPRDRRVMTTFEVAERSHADRVRYNGEPCSCEACIAAGVSDKDTRFVPTLVGDDEERAYNPAKRCVEITGHWAHGEELRRWYVAKDAFFSLLKPKQRRFFATAVSAREPGQEG